MNRNNLRNGVPPLAALAVATLAAIALPAMLVAQSPARGGGSVVASATIYAGGVDISPSVRHNGGVVTVSGNGMVFQQAIKAGASPSIGVFDPEGQLLPDGVYTWEVELFPDARTAKKLREAAAKNGGRAPGAWQRQTGTFAIRNGLVAAPELVEAGPAPRAASAGAALPTTLAGASAARGPAGDDDAAVGSRQGVEADMRAALRSQPQAAAAGDTQLEGAGLERSDMAALAMGASLERGPASGALVVASQLGEAQPARRSMFDNSENGANGRDRSSTKR